MALNWGWRLCLVLITCVCLRFLWDFCDVHMKANSMRSLPRFNITDRVDIDDKLDPAPVYHGLYLTYTWPPKDEVCGKDRRVLPEKAAFATLVSSNCVIPALVLAKQLRLVCSKAPILVMALDKLSSDEMKAFSALQVTVRPIEWDLVRATGVRTNKPSPWTYAWNKIAIWTMVEYDKLVLLDLDAFPITNVDELLFAPGFSWTLGQDKGCHFSGMINGGVLVMKPDLAVFQRMKQLVADASSKNVYKYGHAEQGSYELYRFFDKDDPHLFLSPIYNSHPDSCECMETPGRFLIKIVHFFGGMKPWISYRNNAYPNMTQENCRLATYARWWRAYKSLREQFPYLKSTEQKCLA